MKIDVYGTTFADVLVKVETLNMKFDNLIFSKASKLSAGGNGCNVAINLSLAGNEVHYHGEIGDDYAGNIILREFSKNKIQVSESFINNIESTGISLVIVDRTGEKAITSYQGANNIFSDIPKKHLNNHIAICGLGLLPEFEKNLNYILKEVRKNKKKSYAGTSANVVEVKNYLDRKELSGLDFLFLNAREARDISKEEFMSNQANYILNKGIKNVIITEGSRGATLFTRTEKHIHMAAPTVNVVDTTGAGDAFMSGFINEFSRSNSYRKALKKANEAGSNNVMFIGAVK